MDIQPRTLALLPDTFAICRLDADAAFPLGQTEGASFPSPALPRSCPLCAINRWFPMGLDVIADYLLVKAVDLMRTIEALRLHGHLVE
jgi:hypothetical protein